jgi:hypothetical protein
MSKMAKGMIVRPRHDAMLVQGIPQDVLFEDNHMETYILAPGEILDDVLRRQGITQDYIVVPRSKFL